MSDIYRNHVLFDLSPTAAQDISYIGAPITLNNGAAYSGGIVTSNSALQEAIFDSNYAWDLAGRWELSIVFRIANFSARYGCLLASGMVSYTTGSEALYVGGTTAPGEANRLCLAGFTLNTAGAPLRSNPLVADQDYRARIYSTGTQLVLEIDGVEHSRINFAGTIRFGQATIVRIGRNAWDGLEGVFSGVIKHLRVTKALRQAEDIPPFATDLPLIQSASPVKDSAGAVSSGAAVTAYDEADRRPVAETSASAGGDTGTCLMHAIFGLPATSSPAIVDAGNNFWQFAGVGRVEASPPGVSGMSYVNPGITIGWVETVPSSKWALGTADFHIRALINLTAAPPSFFQAVLGTWVANIGFCIFIETTLKVSVRLNTESHIPAASNIIVPGRWTLIDVIREAGTLTIKVDNVVIYTGASSANITKTAGMRIGCNDTNTDNFNGRIRAVTIMTGGKLADASLDKMWPHPGLTAGHFKMHPPMKGAATVTAYDPSAAPVLNHLVARVDIP